MNDRLLGRLFHPFAAVATFFVLGGITVQQGASAMPLEISLNALLEIDPHDLVTIDPGKVVEKCTIYLSAPEHRSRPEKYKLHLLRGYAYLYKDQFKEAVQDFDEVVKLRPKNDFDSIFIRNSALGNQSRSGNSELLMQAKAGAEDLIRMKPDSAKAYLNMAMCLIAVGDFKGSIAYCDKSIALRGDNSGPYYTRGVAHKWNGEYQEALEDLDKCIKLGSYGAGLKAAADPFIMRAELLLDPFDDPGRALSDLNMAHHINPTSFTVQFWSWYWYFKQGKYEIADFLSQRLTKEHPERSMSTLASIATLIQKRNLDDALKLAESMVSQAPKLAYGYYLRGVTRFAKGEYDSAIKDYDKAAKLHENNYHRRGAKAYLLASV
ncbi:MAG: tetratricopeptide repeat protein, partial [Candidatus Saccharimonadales bacterium]